MFRFLRQILSNALLFVVLVTSGCGGGGGGSASVEKGVFELSSPNAFAEARVDSFLFVDVSVNGVAAEFILDTGADAFVISPELAEQAGLRVSGEAGIVTIAGETQVELRRIDEFRFANVVGRDIDAAVLSLNGMDGIVGLPLFRAVVMGIDYETGVLEISASGSVEAARMKEAVAGEVFQSSDFVIDGVEINGRSVGSLRIDTGSSGGIRLSDTVGASLLAEAGETRQVTSSASNGSVEGTAFIAGEVLLGGYSLVDQFVVVQSRALEPGLMGSMVLEQFYLLLDLGGEQVILRKDRDIQYGLIDQDALKFANAA